MRGLGPRLAGAVALSGAAALMYQLTWVRLLALKLGSTAAAVCAVLSVFMGGMALGSWLFGRRADASGSPRRLYSGMEWALGAAAACTPWLFAHLPGPAAVAALLLPTALMGGTMPVLAAHLRRAGESLGEGVSRLYAWNTLGAVVGAAAAGFVTIQWLGVSGTIWAAAALNAAAGALVWSSRGEPAAAAPAAAVRVAALPRAQLWALFALSGLVAMAYEAVWTRLIGLVLGSSVYAFALMLCAFLIGLAAGGALARPLLRRGAGAGLLAGAQLVVAAGAVLSLWLYPQLPFAYLKLYAWLGESSLLSPAKLLLAFIPLLLPTVAMGVSLPWFAQQVEGEKPGAAFGGAYAFNTAGSAIGPWAAAFVLVPALGLVGSALALAAGSAALAAWAACFATRRRELWAGAAAVWAACLVLPGIPAESLHAGVSIYAEDFLKAGRSRRDWQRRLSERALEFKKDGVHASVSVWRYPNGTRSLVIDGKADASDTAADMPTQVLSGHLPLLLRSEPARRVLVVGLGSGVTVGAAARHPGASVEVVEIEPAVVEAAGFFEHVNGGALRRPNVTVVADDARRHLARRTAGYDAIISEPSNPWIAGVSHLFTEEFFALAKSRLAPDGVFCQWFQLYNMTPEALATGLATFRRSFPYVSVWRVNSDLILLGSRERPALAWEDLEARLRREEVRRDLEPLGLGHVPELLARWQLEDEALAALAPGDSPIHTDDRPLLEYLAPIGLGRQALGAANLAALEAASGSAADRFAGASSQRHWLARALLSAGRAEAAARELELLPSAHPWHDGLERDLGELFLLGGNGPAAVALFERRAASRRDARSQLDLARALALSGRREEALGPLERFVGLLGRPAELSRAVAEAGRAPSEARTYFALGAGYARLKEPGRAARLFAFVVEQDPSLLSRLETRQN